MVQFARGLQIQVVDREGLEEFVSAYNKLNRMEDVWGDDSVPEYIYIVSYFDDEPSEFYKTIDVFVNSECVNNEWDEDTLDELLMEGILKKTNKYDVEFVENHRE